MAIGDSRDLEQTRVQLTTWLSGRLPAADDVVVSDLRAPSMGFSNETLLFDLDWRGNGTRHVEPLVIRFRPAAQIFPDYDLGQQYRVMQLLAPTGVPVPRMRWQEPDASVLGASFYVMDRVEGIVPPDQPSYHAADVCISMTPAQRAALWWDGLETMIRIHQLDWRRAGFGFLDAPQWGGTALEQQLGYHRHFLTWAADGQTQPTCEPALAWLMEHQPRNEPVALCWGDSRIGNMLFRDSRCVAVLDWEMVSLGNPEQDLAWWLFLDWHHSSGLEIPRLEGFPSRQETVARYEELMRRRVEHFDYYEVFAAFRFAVIMIRVAHLAVAAGLPTPADFATNNIPTRRLAQLLDLPAPS
jgi:aminoglycoside phosphotransferase (APT) family kinase protein